MNDDDIARRAAEAAQSAADAAWVSAYSALVTAILSLLLVIGAYLAWRVAKATLEQSKAANRQMELDSVEQTRPFVYAHLVPGIAGVGTWDLLLTNTGRSPARNLTIDCDEWPEKDDVFTAPLRTLFSTPRSLPPGATIRTFWKVGVSKPGATWEDGTSEPMGMAKGATLKLEYSSDDPSKPTYCDEYRLDDSILGQTPAAYRGPNPKQGLDSAQQDLHSMLAAIASNIGELRR